MELATKRCSLCGLTKNFTEFYYKKDKAKPPTSLSVYCKVCSIRKSQAWHRAHPKPKKPRRAAKIYTTAELLWVAARDRAQKKGVPFSIQVSDVVVPEVCPVFGFPLVRSANRGPTRQSPTLDRIVPSRGYVPGNVVVISHLANSIKFTASSEEILKVGEWVRSVGA